MAQHDYIISNQTFPNTRADINNVLQALATNNSGTTAPTTQYAGQFWLDTNTPSSTTWTLYIHDGSDDIAFATIDTSANTVNFTDSALDVVTDTTPQLGGNLDLNSNDITGTGNINITGSLTASGNLTSLGIDDNATSTAITIDSSERVGINETSPASLLHVTSSTSDNRIQLTNSSSSDGSVNSGASIQLNATSLIVNNNEASGDILFRTDGFTERMRINNVGNVGIGTTSPDSILDLTSTPNNNFIHFNSTTGGSNGDIIGGFEVNNVGGPIGKLTVNRESTSSSGYMAFQTGSTEKMRINNSGNVGIGTTTPSAGIEVVTGGSDVSAIFTGNGVNIKHPTLNGNLFIGTQTGNDAKLESIGAYPMLFFTNGSERMRIDSSGSVLIKKTTSGFNTAGFEVKSGDEPIYVTTENNSNILVNRRSSDGSLIRFYRSTSEKGSISVSGETVSYNGFTGSHWSRFTDNSKPTILRGTVLETLDEMLDWYNLEYNITTTTKDEDGNDVTNTETFGVPHVLTDSQSVGDTITYNHEGTDVQATIVKEADVKHMMSKVSDTTDAKNVYGVFNCYDEEQSEEGYNDFLVASVGSFLVRIKANETIAKGDLLQSNGDGTAKVQSDDNIKSSSFAKVLSTTIIETYEDGSYLVPCSLMC